MNDALSEELKEFFVEAFEMLEESETSFLQFGKGPDFKAIYSAVFRTFHSLKGAAGMFELQDLQHHMHQLENILTECQPRNTFTQNEVSFFLKGIDAAKKIISGEKISFSYEVTQDSATQKNSPSPAVIQSNSSTSVASAPKKDDSPASPKPQIIKASHGEIVIIDDEEGIIEILELILGMAGFKVRKFINPIEGIASIKQKAPDLVFTDMMMPQVSGFEVLKATKAAHPDLPVIFISGHMDKAMLVDLIQKGAYSAIEKPFKDSQLISIALTAIREVKLKKIIQRSLNLLLYQFADLDDFLIQQGKKDVSSSIKNELQTLIEAQKEYRNTKRPA